MEAELAIVVPWGLKLSGSLILCRGCWVASGGSFCRGRLSTLGPVTSHAEPSPGGAGERAQEWGMLNRSEGNVKTGENVTLGNN